MVKKTVLDSGLIVISEQLPEFRSFALSYTLKSGSRAESSRNNGIHHLVEHMMFKGSKGFDLKQIADISDRLGGRLNAFTGKEVTQYYIKAINEKLEESFKLLTDIVLNSTFPEGEFLKERNVVVQEINESKDNPDTFAFENFFEGIFGKNPIGYPIAGKKKVVSQFERERIFDFYREMYKPQKLLLAAVGDINHDKLVDMAQGSLLNFPSRNPDDFSYNKPDFSYRSFTKRNTSLKQIYVVLGFKGISSVSPLKYEFMLMNDILGAGMSSRLFTKIREEKGLAYTISSFAESFLESGVHFIYSIVEPAKIGEYLYAVRDEILHLKKNGVSQLELQRAKDHIKSAIILGYENNIVKMRFNVNQELYLKKELEVKDIIKKIDRVSINDINQLTISNLNFSEVSAFLYGDIKESQLDHIEFK